MERSWKSWLQRIVQAKDIMCPGAELRRLVIDDLSKVGLTEVKAESTGSVGFGLAGFYIEMPSIPTVPWLTYSRF